MSKSINDIFDAIERKDADGVADWIHMQGFIQYKIDTLSNESKNCEINTDAVKSELELEERLLITFMSFFILFCVGFSVLCIIPYIN